MVTGDLLAIQTGIIAHQVNCQGVFGAGLAKSIAAKYPECKQAYLDYVNKYPKDKLLGNVCLFDVTDNLSIANIFGQFNYGRQGCFTDYKALDKGFCQTQTSLSGHTHIRPLRHRLRACRWRLEYR